MVGAKAVALAVAATVGVGTVAIAAAGSAGTKGPEGADTSAARTPTLAARPAPDAESDRARVLRVIDGDTLDVDLAGTPTRVRLLNIDAPETKHPDEPVECLGPEASSFLTRRLPPGTAVQLAYDTVRHDRHGRLLAGVFESNRLVNAEIAAAGYGFPIQFDDNIRFLNEVSVAAETARQTQQGAHSAAPPCTVPARLNAHGQTLATIQPPAAAASEAELQAGVERAAPQIQAAQEFHNQLIAGELFHFGFFTTAERTAFARKLGRQIATARVNHQQRTNALQERRAQRAVAPFTTRPETSSSPTAQAQVRRTQASPTPAPRPQASQTRAPGTPAPTRAPRTTQTEDLLPAPTSQ